MARWLNCVVATAGTLAFSGCAFREPSPARTEPAPTAAFEIGIDWREIEAGKPMEVPLYRRQAILAPGSDLYSAGQFVSLPPEVPGAVAISARLPEEVSSQGPDFMRAYLNRGADRVELPARLIYAPAAGRHELRVMGLSAVFGRERTDTGTLEMEIFSRERRLTRLSVPVRTPPSQVEMRALSLREFSEASQELLHAFRVLPFDKKSFHITQVLRLTNREAVPVEVRLPRILPAAFSQRATHYRHRDTGCDGSGYAIDQSSGWQDLSTSVFLLPLNGTILSELTTSLRPESRDQVQLAKIDPAQEALYGIYAEGAGAESWTKAGPLPSELQSIQVPGGCQRECVSQWCSCGRWCKVLVTDPASFSEEKGCRCEEWKTHRDATTVTVGTARESAVLRFLDAPPALAYRFADLDSHMDPEVRRVQVFTPQLPVEWVPDQKP